MKEKLIAALKRAAWTAAETALPMIPMGAAIEEVEWVHVASVVAVASLLSLLKSVIAGMPETKHLQTEEEDEDE
ncbi:MAG: hypothetical protein IKD79_00520 [Oscillospiraceae bacterium]|nr:hypothetical protein [Oscillospiraceae bacterium]